MKPWLPLPLLILLFALPLSARNSQKNDAEPRRAPSFVLPTATGTISSDSLSGKVVLVDFWASWCSPCQRSFPWLDALHDRYSARGLVVVAINLDKDRHAAEEFLKKYPARFRVAFDPDGNAAKAFKVMGMPTSFLVSPAGVVLYSHVGFNPKDTDRFEARIKEALPQ